MFFLPFSLLPPLPTRREREIWMAATLELCRTLEIMQSIVKRAVGQTKKQNEKKTRSFFVCNNYG